MVQNVNRPFDSHHKRNINIISIFRHEQTGQYDSLEPFDVRVTAIALVQTTLWVGTASGHVIILDVTNYQPITVFQRYKEAIRSIAWARNLGEMFLISIV